ncbi:MAG: toll/interleukin-1 receptor domain-containing protein [Clostridia bacterium]|nr:toll/interleukin-1 receptor domain-containing protein [Clostridia bacterium]
MGYAFISYSSQEQRQLKKVQEFLKTNGIAFWSAPDDIPIGSKYSEVITRAISNASCVLFLLSDRSQNSTYCKLEIALALKQEKPVIPVQLEDVILNDEFALYLGESELFPIPRAIATPKTNRLRNQLLLLCSDPEEAPREPPDPSYRIGWFRKGTWLQLFGWIWMVGGIVPFFALADILFPIPNAHHGAADSGLNWYNTPVIAQMTLKSNLLVTALELLGLLTVCYGFSLNRKRLGGRRLLFKQFSLCQVLLIIAWVGFGANFLLLANELDDYYSPFWIECSNYVLGGSLILFLVTFVIWLLGRVRWLYRKHKTKK